MMNLHDFIIEIMISPPELSSAFGRGEQVQDQPSAILRESQDPFQWDDHVRLQKYCSSSMVPSSLASTSLNLTALVRLPIHRNCLRAEWAADAENYSRIAATLPMTSAPAPQTPDGDGEYGIRDGFGITRNITKRSARWTRSSQTLPRPVTSLPPSRQLDHLSRIIDRWTRLPFLTISPENSKALNHGNPKRMWIGVSKYVDSRITTVWK